MHSSSELIKWFYIDYFIWSLRNPLRKERVLSSLSCRDRKPCSGRLSHNCQGEEGSTDWGQIWKEKTSTRKLLGPEGAHTFSKIHEMSLIVGAVDVLGICLRISQWEQPVQILFVWRGKTPKREYRGWKWFSLSAERFLPWFQETRLFSTPCTGSEWSKPRRGMWNSSFVARGRAQVQARNKQRTAWKRRRGVTGSEHRVPTLRQALPTTHDCCLQPILPSVSASKESCDALGSL